MHNALQHFDDDHFGGVSATGPKLIHLGVAAHAALFLVAGTVLGAILTAELLNHGMVVGLGALFVFLLGLVVILGFLDLIQVSHHEAAGMKLAGQVVYEGLLHDLLLFVP